MGRYLYAPHDAGRVVAALADERTRLVTLTVTAAAYHANPATGAFNSDDDEVVADLAAPVGPHSALGFLVEALDVRRRAGRRPFTVLSCDNLPDNGDVTRAAIVSYARLRDERLARWIEESVAFPSSMVDRITPKTTASDRERLADEFGVIDRWPVVTEAFSQWVVEDSFCNGRPPLDEVGVRFVADVRPYSLIKTLMLNAAHVALGPLGLLAGHRSTDDLMRDPVFRAYVDQLTRDEITPLLPRVAGFDLATYRRTVLERLMNPNMGDQLSRLCRAASLKLPRHVLPTIVAARARGRPHALLTLAVAAWCRHLRGLDDLGEEITIEEPAADRLRALALAAGTDPRPLLAESAVFGSLAHDEGFVDALEHALQALDRDGARAAIAASLGVGEPLVA